MSNPTTKTKCPRCDSPAPHLHPALAFEGETETCTHTFHAVNPRPETRAEAIRKLTRDLQIWESSPNTKE